MSFWRLVQELSQSISPIPIATICLPELKASILVNFCVVHTAVTVQPCTLPWAGQSPSPWIGEPWASLTSLACSLSSLFPPPTQPQAQLFSLVCSYVRIVVASEPKIPGLPASFNPETETSNWNWSVVEQLQLRNPGIASWGEMAIPGLLWLRENSLAEGREDGGRMEQDGALQRNRTSLHLANPWMGVIWPKHK